MESRSLKVLLAASVLGGAVLSAREPARAETPVNGTTIYSGGIFITGSPVFREQIQGNLDHLREAGFGGLLTRLDQSGQNVVIGEAPYGTGSYTEHSASTVAITTDVPGADGVLIPGIPSGSFVGIDVGQVGDEPGQVCFDTSLSVLHELNHAVNAAYGTTLTRESLNPQFPYTSDGENQNFTSAEEANAVGVGPYASNPYSENAYRAEEGLPARHDYAILCPVPEPDTIATGNAAPPLEPVPPVGPILPVSAQDPPQDPAAPSPVETAVVAVPPPTEIFDDGNVLGGDPGVPSGFDFEGGGGGGGGFSGDDPTFSEE